jgi:hypothetical protein
MENIVSRISPAVVALSLVAAVVATPADAAQRAFVASAGSDDNTALGCVLEAPCRSFAAAMTVVDNGGEVIALDAAGYGPVYVTKSVTITANPGFYAGIAVASGDAVGVMIYSPNINVILRGLNINGIGGSAGIDVPAGTHGTSLSIENCVISNFPGGYGVIVNTDATVRIVNSLIRDGFYGVGLDKGATATISGSKFAGHIYSIFIDVTTATTTTAAISDTVVSGSGVGVSSRAEVTGATALVSVIRSTLSNNAYGADVYSSAGTAVLTISDSMVTGHHIGLSQGATGGTSTLESLGNNTVRQNGTDTSGTITTVSPM